MGMRFEWDENKRIANIQKHGIDFQYILPRFRDPVAVRYEDNRHAYGKTRVIILGEVKDTLLHVVYVPREDGIRIISARKTNKRERRRYEQKK